jgi:hypothetical protein
MISEALRGGELMDDGMKDGSGLFLALGTSCLRLSRRAKAAGRTKLELRVRHTRAKGEKQHGGGFSPRVILKARAMISGRGHAQ